MKGGLNDERRTGRHWLHIDQIIYFVCTTKKASDRKSKEQAKKEKKKMKRGNRRKITQHTQT